MNQVTSSLFRKTIALTLLIVVAATLGAQAQEPHFINASNMKEVFISEAIDVVLVAADPKDDMLKMSESTGRKLRVYITGNRIHISGSGSFTADRPVLYLSVGRLERLTIDGNVHLTTHNSLKTGKMDVYVGGDSKMQLKTDGKVQVHAFGDAEVKYEIRDLSRHSQTKRTA